MTDEKDKNPKNKPKEDFEFKPLHEAEPESTAPSSPQPSSTESPKSPPLEEPAPLDPSKSWFIRNKTLSIVLAFLMILSAMGVISLIRSDDDAVDTTTVTTEFDEVPVNVIEARLGRFQDRIDAVGTLKGEAEIELRFEVEGKIQQFKVNEGDRIKRGQIIAKIDDSSAESKVKQARIEVEKSEKLYQLGGLSKTKLSEARLELEVAQTEYDKTRLKASRDGILGDKSADVGEYVTPQRKIATLVAIKNVVVKVGIIEKQIDKVYPGQKILVTVDAYPGNIFEGTIDSISPIIIGESKTAELTAKIPNEDNLLLPGMFARARVITFEADDAISVPNDALVKSPGGFQVYVVNKENKAEVRDVEVGYVAAEFTQVESGLSPGEVVVVQKPPELKAGSKVKIIEIQDN